MYRHEISDLITAVDPHSGHRLPVRRAEVIHQLRESGDERAARIAAAVLLSLTAYFVLPFRASTLAMVIGLAPMTLLRPLAIAAACLGAVLNGGGGPALLVGVIAGAAVLCVEPVVHRRWYQHVQ
ncbi:hypothetical protein LK07_00690 [Streptomyces pluripotens]|uniref:Uncharacterized protein n=1 Tax=Streptomyces pluripotens TaxID=1355015 RepID=A0A221NS46_9ACTN|nr:MULTISPECIES: hypothetical protein [Streptomyces]ASN22790.1 hypothetical protein LK07_00690 [Streptomyces pluripotens]